MLGFFHRSDAICFDVYELFFSFCLPVVKLNVYTLIIY